MRVCAVYRCRHCGAVTVCAVGLYEGERVLPDLYRTAMVDIHSCDGCLPKFGVADLVGWET